METDAPVQVLKETLTGEHVFAWNNAVTLMLPGLTVIFAFFIVPALATELLKEKEAGSLRRLVAAPLPRAALIGGKVLAFLLVVLAQVTLLFGIGAVIMDMVLGRSALGLALVTLALGLSATTLGMLIAAVARSIDQAGSLGLLLIFLLGFLGGGFSPTNPPYRGEGFLAILSRLTPQANAQMAYHTLIIQNGGVGDVLLNVGYLLALSLVFFLIAVWRFRFE
jgi:ABC-2 type transport system permease protein